MENNVIFGGLIVWHTYPEDKPKENRSIIVAYTFNEKCKYKSVIGEIYFGGKDVIFDHPDSIIDVVAWAYVDSSVPKDVYESKKK